jgi:hypothetical protein
MIARRCRTPATPESVAEVDYRRDFEPTHACRTHTCGGLRAAGSGQEARLSGWVHAKGDHGGRSFMAIIESVVCGARSCSPGRSVVTKGPSAPGLCG